MKLGVSEKQGEAKTTADRATVEIASCMVRLGGDLRNEVPKLNVTAPEIVILRALHGGSDAVVKVQKIGTRQVSISGEKARLMARYGQREEQAKLVDSLFPGYRPQFPLTIAEIEEMAVAEFSDGEEAQEAQDAHEAILS